MSIHKVVLVVGVIGSGKTSLCRELGRELDALVLYEKAQEHGNPFISSFYDDMQRWAFTLQIHQLATRFRQHDLAQKHVLNGMGHVVIDGGFHLDVCFAHMIRKAGLMEQREFDSYESIFHAMTQFVLYPNVLIRLNTSPEIALERVQRRATEHPERQSEAARVTADYLKALDVEIAQLCRVLASKGVEVVNSFWDEDRHTSEQRVQAVKGLARQVRELVQPDPFMAGWQRSVG